MKLIIFLSIITIFLSLSACKLLKVKGEVGGVEVEAQTQTDKKNGEGGFCPPGQAKKGNC